MYDADLDGSVPPDLELANYGFTEADLSKEFHLTGLLQAGFLSGETGPMTLGEIIARLQQVYTDKIGVEYMHIWDHEQARETRNADPHASLTPLTPLSLSLTLSHPLTHLSLVAAYRSTGSASK